MGGRLLAHAFPPDIAVVGKGDVGVDDVSLSVAMALKLVFSLVPGATPK
jgi:hypothetical protein